jgi:hypothetical protein
MPKSISELEKMLDANKQRLQQEIVCKFTEVPLKVCECGKPTVFIFPSKKFKCSRCGRSWQLVVEVREIGVQ